MLLKPLNCYTSVIEKLITLPEFAVIHLEVLLLRKCKAIPDLKETGMAINKCSTVCIKELSKLMIQTNEWKLIKALIEHGTVPDIKCIEISIERYNEDRALFLTQQIEKAKHTICYDKLLCLAVYKAWNGKFVQHCLEKGAKFADKDILWTMLQWKNKSTKDIMLNQLVSQDKAMDARNDSGQSPLDFLLEKGMLKDALAMLKLDIDAHKTDIIKTIKTLEKCDTNRGHIIEILCGIIQNKKKALNYMIPVNRN